MRLAWKARLPSRSNVWAPRSPDAYIEDILYLKDRRLFKNRALRFAECARVEKCSTVVMVSKTSDGKTYVAQALDTAACRMPCDLA